MASTPSTAKKGWKEHLLKSGIPLEYEVAACLLNADMAVDADFSFLRRDIGGIKELSVDIAARDYGPGADDIGYELNLLVECKYRSPEKTLLLLSYPEGSYTPVTLGGTFAVFDAFVPYHISLDAFVGLEEKYDYVYKGVEVYEHGAIEDEIKHGIHQLRYAAPVFFRRFFDFQLGMHPEDRCAIFYTAILVTNAPLRLLKPNVGIEAIRQASSLEDISTPIDTAILHSGYGPDFEEHVRTVFQVDDARRKEMAEELTAELIQAGKKFGFRDDPVSVIKEHASGDNWACRHMGSQFFVTNIAALPELISSIQKFTRRAYGSRTKRRKAYKPRKSRTAPP